MNVTKGPGDLPGDSSNPNSPDYVEPDFGWDEAASIVARDLDHGGDIPELVEDIADSASLLRWIAKNVEFDHDSRKDFRRLLGHAEKLEAMCAAMHAKLNAPSEPEE